MKFPKTFKLTDCPTTPRDNKESGINRKFEPKPVLEPAANKRR